MKRSHEIITERGLGKQLGRRDVQPGYWSRTERGDSLRILVLSFPDLKKIYPQRPHQFLKHLSRNHEVTVLSMNSWWLGPRHDPYLEECLRNVDIQYPSQMRIHPVLQSYSMARKSIRSIRENKTAYDVILSFNELASSRVVSKSERIPLVLDICDDIPDYIGSSLRVPYVLRPIGKSVAKVLLNGAVAESTAVICTVPSIGEKYNIPALKSAILVNGVDLALFSATGGSREGLPGVTPGDFVVGFVGSVGEWIDFRNPMIAIRRLNKRGSRIKLAIVGDGSNLEAARQQSVELGISRDVLFTGSVAYKDVPGIISNFDVCILPFARTATSEHALPLKLFEYMACGKPIISTRVKGVIDSVGNLIYYCDTVDEYVYRLRALVQSGSPDGPLKEGIQLVRERHDWSKISGDIEKMLFKAVEPNAG